MKSFRKAVAIASIIATSPIVLAGHYDGPNIDYNFTRQEPGEIHICDKYLSTSEKSGYQMDACRKGESMARVWADRFAGEEGRMAGYLRGYSWGLYKLVNAYKNDGDQMAKGARAIDTLSSKMDVGKQAGRIAGEKDGNRLGAQEARGRFARAVQRGGEGQLPSRQVVVPNISYRGEANAYEKYVGRIPSVRDELKKHNDDVAIFQEVSSKKYIKLPEHRRPFEYWFDGGRYAFESARWDEPGLALNVWRGQPGIDQNQYSNLGQPITKKVQDPTTGELKDEVVISGQERQSVFHEAFKKSYAFYANYYFSSKFWENIDQGQLLGEKLGEEVGKRVAFVKGQSQAFNRVFKTASESEFKKSLSKAYTSAFQSTYSAYENASVLSLEFLDIIGSDNDGIIQPGERISAKFRIRNEGGVGSPLKVSISGNVLNTNKQTFEIGQLSEQVFIAEGIANVDSRISNGSAARLVLSVESSGDVLRDDLSQTVNNLVELRGVTASLDTLSGSGQVAVTAANNSTVTTPGNVSATLRINGKTYEAIAGKVGPGDAQTMTLLYSGIDPMIVLTGSISGEVTIYHNGNALESSSVTFRSRNPVDEAIAYFDAVANDRGTLPAGVSGDDRTVDMIRLLDQMNTREVDRTSKRGGRNMYRKGYKDGSITIAEKIANTFTSGFQSELSKDRYHKLASVLIKQSKRFKRFLFWTPKRKHYRKQINRFSKKKLK